MGVTGATPERTRMADAIRVRWSVREATSAILVGALLRGGAADHVLVARPSYDDLQYLHVAPVGLPSK